jgi:methylaspartate ammonia-lyase
MLSIERILSATGQGAYFCEDFAALQAKPIPEEERSSTDAITPGFTKVRETAEVLSVGFRLTTGQVVWGDCVGVSYAGKAGRDTILKASEAKREWDRLAPSLFLHSSISSYKSQIAKIDRFSSNALRYGISQAILKAASASLKKHPVRLICDEWDYALTKTPLKLQGSSGNDRKGGADKMIGHRLDALPHLQVDDFGTQCGKEGVHLLKYAAWLKARLLKSSPYAPSVHFDVHGALAQAFDSKTERIADFLAKMAELFSPLEFRIESPLIGDSFEAHVEGLASLRRSLQNKGIPVAVVADEWANSKEAVEVLCSAGAVDMIHLKMPNLGGLHSTFEALRVCRSHGVKVLLGGSCIETDLSTRSSVHVGLAARPDYFLVKPGMGIHEGVSLVRNEMQRSLSELEEGTSYGEA